jgi:hypothetical protein
LLLRLHQKIAPEWASNLVGFFEILSFARGSPHSNIVCAAGDVWIFYVDHHQAI